MVWLGFLLALAVMLLVGRKSLWVGFLCGAILLGLFNLTISEIGSVFVETLTDPSILLLGISVGLISLIGGALEESGLIRDFVENLRMKRKLFLALGPAFLGMLPMPGGALLSAPLVKRAGKDISSEQFVAINVWFRHAFILIYPLGALLTTTKMAGLHLYTAMIYLIPGFLIMAGLGFFFLLRGITGNLSNVGNRSYRKIFIPILIILAAPIIHLFLLNIFPSWIKEIPLVIGVVTSLFLAWKFGDLKRKDIPLILRKMKPWKFFLIIIGMFLFLHTFIASDISSIIADIVFSKTFLIVAIAALLGFVAGRVEMPFAILLPIFYAKFGVESLTYLEFAIMFFSIFIGYVISPIHPCVSVSLEFFNSNLKDFYRRLLSPALISLGCVLVISVSAL
jgi:integral membrane protein (TIGR00529 family)